MNVESKYLFFFLIFFTLCYFIFHCWRWKKNIEREQIYLNHYNPFKNVKHKQKIAFILPSIFIYHTLINNLFFWTLSNNGLKFFLEVGLVVTLITPTIVLITILIIYKRACLDHEIRAAWWQAVQGLETQHFDEVGVVKYESSALNHHFNQQIVWYEKTIKELNHAPTLHDVKVQRKLYQVCMDYIYLIYLKFAFQIDLFDKIENLEELIEKQEAFFAQKTAEKSKNFYLLWKAKQNYRVITNIPRGNFFKMLTSKFFFFGPFNYFLWCWNQRTYDSILDYCDKINYEIDTAVNDFNVLIKHYERANQVYFFSLKNLEKITNNQPLEYKVFDEPLVLNIEDIIEQTTSTRTPVSTPEKTKEEQDFEEVIEELAQIDNRL